MEEWGQGLFCNLLYEFLKKCWCCCIYYIYQYFVCTTSHHFEFWRVKKWSTNTTECKAFISSKSSTKCSYLGSDRLVSHSIRSADSPLYNTEGQGANGSQNSEYQQLVVEQQSLTVVKGCGSCYRLQEIQNNITGKSGLKRYCFIIGQFTDNLGINPLLCKSNTHLIHA